MLLLDLEKDINRRMKEGCEILVCIDANEQMQEDKSRIKKFTTKLGLVDIASEKFCNPPPTYVRKNTGNRIYFLLYTNIVFENVISYGMAPLGYEKSLGDHRAM